MVRPHGHLGVRRFISAFKSRMSFIFGFALPKEQAGCPEGSEHGIGGLRMAPGDVAHVPRTPSPVAEAGLIAKHFRPRARLRRLLVRLRRPTLHRPLRGLRQRAFAPLRSPSSHLLLAARFGCRRTVQSVHIRCAAHTALFRRAAMLFRFTYPVLCANRSL